MISQDLAADNHDQFTSSFERISAVWSHHWLQNIDVMSAYLLNDRIFAWL